MIKLDKIDKKILAELDLNSRQHASKIAKKLKISRMVVEYRIKRFVESGLIRTFNAFIDPAKFGLTSWKVYVSFQNMTREKEKEILDFLEKNGRVWWIILCSGPYDLMFCILGENVHEFYKTFLEFQSAFSENVFQVEINTHIDPEFYSRGYLMEKESEIVSKPFLIVPKKLEFDELDLKILRLLSKNCRLPVTEIAKELKSTPRVIQYKMNKLEKDGVITWYRLNLDVEKIGKEYYKTLVNFKGLTGEKEKKFVQLCRFHPNIINMSKAVGPWDFEFEVEIDNYRDYTKLMKEIKDKSSDLIKKYQSLLIYKELKYENNFLDYGFKIVT